MKQTLFFEAGKVSSVAQKWPEDFIDDVTLHTRVLSGKSAKRHLSILKTLDVGAFSSKASVHSFKLENFGLQLINKTNYTHAYVISHDALTGLKAIPAHATGENNWVAATWELPKVPSLQEYLNRVWAKIKRIMQLPSNWDSYGAIQVPLRTIARALEVLIEAYEVQDQMGYEPLIPFIAPCADGSIQLEWENNNKELEARVAPPAEEKIVLLRGSKKEQDYQEDIIDSPAEIVHYLLWLWKNE
ncbi:MAG: hypothetical protein FJ117_13715 [Deltaproteobacteria bacterium]|nr:hypothetical protein [Deltaproteobacteria bacterium]